MRKVQGRSNAGLDLDEFPALKAWQARVEGREAVGRAMAKAREFVGVGMQGSGADAAAARAVLLGQRART